MLVASARNECGTNRETANCGRIRVLTRSSGSAKTGGNLPLRPDGGVVTQRTANPLTVARFRDSSHNSPSVPPIAFQGLRGRSANRKSRSKPDRAETVKQGSVHESGGRAAICPEPVKGPHPMTMKELEPCPFCGQSVRVRMRVDQEEWDAARVACDSHKCGALGPWVDLGDFETVSDAVSEAALRWNARASQETTR
jgi:hypothetical protein